MEYLAGRIGAVLSVASAGCNTTNLVANLEVGHSRSHGNGLSSDFKTGNVGESGTYTFDGTYLVVNGGFKRKVTFTEDGNGFEWERTSIVVRY